MRIEKSCLGTLWLGSLTFAATMLVGGSPLASAQTHTPIVDPIPAAIPMSGITVGLEQVMSGLISPVAGAVAPGDPDHLYVADQTGQIWSVDVSGRRHPHAPRLFLDISSRLIHLGLGRIKYDERGLLGLVFHPDFKRNGLFYTYASEPVKGRADFSTMPVGVPANCQNVLLEWHATDMGDDEDIVRVDPLPREVLRIDKPQINHNGGAILFDTKELLYLSLGDGGNANDSGVGHTTQGNSQTLTLNNVLGKILRIDPLGHNSNNGHYGIPADNPFADTTHPLAGPHEIYAMGLRNPWRMSLDAKSNNLYVGDVGQNDIEEIDIIAKGGNYGWPIKEGTFLFDTTLPGRGGEGFVYANSPASPTNLLDPIAEYDHADNEQPPFHSTPDSRVAIIGGFVYHGDEIESLQNKYVFGDYSAEIGEPVAGHLFMLKGPDNAIQQLNVQGRPALGLAVLGFAQGHDGELYLLANTSGTLLGTTGVVMKIVPVSDKE